AAADLAPGGRRHAGQHGQSDEGKGDSSSEHAHHSPPHANIGLPERCATVGVTGPGGSERANGVPERGGAKAEENSARSGLSAYSPGRRVRKQSPDTAKIDRVSGAGSFDAELLDAVAEGARVDAKPTGRPARAGDDPVGIFQHGRDVFA